MANTRAEEEALAIPGAGEEGLSDEDVLNAIATQAQLQPTEVVDGKPAGFTSSELRDLFIAMGRSELWADASIVAEEEREGDFDEDRPYHPNSEFDTVDEDIDSEFWEGDDEHDA